MKIYAEFWHRAGAFAADYVIILTYLAVITLLSLLINSPLGVNHSVFAITHWLFANRLRAQLTGFLLITLPVTLYFAISESSVRQATWGKRRLNLIVTDKHGNRIRFLRALARTFLKFIPWEISHTLIWEIYFSPGINSVLINSGFVLVYIVIGLNIASLVMTKTNQTLYDLLAGAYVLQQPS